MAARLRCRRSCEARDDSPASDLLRERRQRKVTAGHLADRLARLVGKADRAFDLSDVSIRQSLTPIVPLPKLASFPGRSNVELLAQDALLRPGEVVKCLGGEGLVHVETFGRIGRIFCGTIGFSTSRSYMSKRRQR